MEETTVACRDQNLFDHHAAGVFHRTNCVSTSDVQTIERFFVRRKIFLRVWQKTNSAPTSPHLHRALYMNDNLFSAHQPRKP